jgi:hypothetical protein
MSSRIHESYVTDALAVQGVSATPEAARAIAAALAAQLAAIESAYGAVPFEAEPATFAAVTAGERP